MLSDWSSKYYDLCVLLPLQVQLLHQDPVWRARTGRAHLRQRVACLQIVIIADLDDPREPHKRSVSSYKEPRATRLTLYCR